MKQVYDQNYIDQFLYTKRYRYCEPQENEWESEAKFSKIQIILLSKTPSHRNEEEADLKTEKYPPSITVPYHW